MCNGSAIFAPVRYTSGKIDTSFLKNRVYVYSEYLVRLRYAHLSLVVGQALGNGSYKVRSRSTAYSTPELLKTRITGSPLKLYRHSILSNGQIKYRWAWETKYRCTRENICIYRLLDGPWTIGTVTLRFDRSLYQLSLTPTIDPPLSISRSLQVTYNQGNLISHSVNLPGIFMGA